MISLVNSVPSIIFTHELNASTSSRSRSARASSPSSPCRGIRSSWPPAAWTRSSAKGILPREVFERWGAALCESMLLGAKKTYCPYKDCSAMMLVDDDGDVVAESECPSCRRLFCARGGVALWHAGVTCAEYKKLGKGDRGKEDRLLLEMAKGRKWKRCPKCTFFVEKRDGCLHITCRCGFEFCYGCGNKWGITHSSCSTA